MATKVVGHESHNCKLASVRILKSWRYANEKRNVSPRYSKYGASKEAVKISISLDHSESRDVFIKRVLKNQFHQRTLYFYLSRYLKPDEFIELLYKSLNYPRSRKILNERGFGYLSQYLAWNGMTNIILAFDNYNDSSHEVQIIVDRLASSIHNKCVLIITQNLKLNETT